MFSYVWNLCLTFLWLYYCAEESLASRCMWLQEMKWNYAVSQWAITVLPVTSNLLVHWVCILQKLHLACEQVLHWLLVLTEVCRYIIIGPAHNLPSLFSQMITKHACVQQLLTTDIYIYRNCIINHKQVFESGRGSIILS